MACAGQGLVIVQPHKAPPSSAAAFNVVATLTGLTALGQILAYGLTVFLANRLEPEAFAVYVSAVAAFLLAGKLATAGVERLALRVLPTAYASGDWSLIRGFLGFAARRSGLYTAIVCLAVLTLAAWLGLTPEQSAGLMIGFLALPLGVATSIGGEMLTALGQPRRAALLMRLPVPLTAIAVVFGAHAFGIPISGVLAVGAWSLGWLVAAVMIALVLAKSLPPEIWRSVPRATEQQWRKIAQPLWLYRGSTALMAQASLLALVWSGTAATEVTAYVAATSTVAIVLLLGNASNRLYARDLALVLDQYDSDGLARLRAHRRAWLLPLAGLFLAAVFLVPELVLGLFRPGIGYAATPALQILSVAAAVTLGLALAPTYLSYRGRAASVYTAMFAANVLQLILLYLLLPAGGASGAALAYAAISIFFYTSLAVNAVRDVQRLSAPD
jgi:O-antigen/teichoic acid export membrane protein